jgi:hypothetical protein
MIKAIISNGVIVPREPLPDDWKEGTEVAVERSSGDDSSVKDSNTTDIWMDEVEAVARQGDSEDDLRLEVAIQEIRRREKALARKNHGLEP